MLQKMAEYFDSRVAGYEEHQLKHIACAKEFYPFTANCLPQNPYVKILDLGCGTGLELNYYFKKVPTANITGIDLAPGMLEVLKNKFPDKSLTLIEGSYLDTPFGECKFDAVISVESLHHFTKEVKISLYKKIRRALRPGGFFILTDYFSLTDDEELENQTKLISLKKEQNLKEHEIYHYDIPLTVNHEKEALVSAGFFSVNILKNWGTTCTIKASN